MAVAIHDHDDEEDEGMLLGFWVDTPVFVIAWRSQSTINLFKDAMDKIANIPLKKRSTHHCFPFIVNFLLNDGSRQVMPIQKQQPVSSKALQDASEHLTFRLVSI